MEKVIFFTDGIFLPEQKISSHSQKETFLIDHRTEQMITTGDNYFF